MEIIILDSFQILVEIMPTIEGDEQYLVTEDLEGITTQQDDLIEIEE